ncbi:DUF6622 family protein [Pararobbsia silviterrae]|nr:DUF6622 family protein [Pararobbsia silviterrae]
MFTSILVHTPHWVWGVFALLIVVGVKQTLPRRRSVRSAIALPLVLTALSLYGVASNFAHEPLALVAWALGAGALLAGSLATGAWRGVRWSASGRCLVVPGSFIPLVLFIVIFIVKFGVGIVLATDPAMGGDAGFASVVGLIYGAFSGTFLGRGVAMWRVAYEALHHEAASSPL